MNALIVLALREPSRSTDATHRGFLERRPSSTFELSAKQFDLQPVHVAALVVHDLEASRAERRRTTALTP
jgi:hypothetical protein